MYVVEYACDGKRFGMYETKEDAQKAVLANVEEAPEMKRSIFDFTLKEQETSWKDIKTFDDACTALGGCNNALVEGYYDALSMASDGVENAFIGLLGADTLAYIKLRIITAAINEGWEPKFTENEWRYYPWFYLFTEEEYSRFTEEKKQRCVLRAGTVRMRMGVSFVRMRLTLLRIRLRTLVPVLPSRAKKKRNTQAFILRNYGQISALERQKKNN